MLLLSGVGTNAIGYDLAPEVNFFVLRIVAVFISGIGFYGLF